MLNKLEIINRNSNVYAIYTNNCYIHVLYTHSIYTNIYIFFNYFFFYIKLNVSVPSAHSQTNLNGREETSGGASYLIQVVHKIIISYSGP